MKKSISFKISVIFMVAIMFFSANVIPFSVIAENTTAVEIISAEYGHKGEKHNVKAVLQAMVENNTLPLFTVNSSSMGCSPSGTENYLTVTYKEDNITKYASVKQDKTFSIPFAYDVKQPAETLALLKEPLATTNEEKVWPTTGVRGFNFGGLMGSFSANPGNEGMYVTEETFKRLKSWGVNCLRIPIAVDSGYDWTLDTIPADDPVAPYKHHLEGLRVALKLAEKYDIWIIPSGDNVVGRQIDIMYNGADGSGYNTTLTQLWEYIAKNYGSHPRLLGYDLLNEPNTANDVAYYMDTVLPMLIKKVRAIDKNTFIIIEPATFAMPNRFESLEPVDDPKAVYSFHFYWPHQYTHQGIGDYSNEYTYPGMMGNFPSDSPVLWNKARMKDSVQAVVDFQEKYDATIWIGEFGAVRWAGNPAQWIRDTISIWEEYGWDWCYHSYGGYNGFNQTFDETDEQNNVMDGGKSTDAIKALIEGFSLNGKPRKNVKPNEPAEKPKDENTNNESKPQGSVETPDSDEENKKEDEDSVVVLSNSGIKVAALGLSKEWKLKTYRIAKGEEYNKIRDELPPNTSGFAVYNLSLLDSEEKDVNFDSKMEVTIPLSNGMNDVVLYYVDENYKFNPIEAYIGEKGITFETEKLGKFVILKSSGKTTTNYVINTLVIVLVAVAALIALLEIGFIIVRSILKRKKAK